MCGANTIFVGAAEGCESISHDEAFAAFGSSYKVCRWGLPAEATRHATKDHTLDMSKYDYSLTVS